MNTEERVALKSRVRIGELNNSHIQKYKSLTDSGYIKRHFTFYIFACEENVFFSLYRKKENNCVKCTITKPKGISMKSNNRHLSPCGFSPLPLCCVENRFLPAVVLTSFHQRRAKGG